MLTATQARILAIALAVTASASAYALDPVMKVYVETPLQPVIYGVTNLPDGSELILTLSRQDSGYVAQSKMQVLDGHFKTERFSAGGHPLNPGTYQIHVSMSMAELQSRQVQAVIGQHGEKMTGKLVKPSPIGGPMFEYVTEVQLGGAANAVLDAKARAISEAELQRWAVQSCSETIDMVNSGVRNGTLQGREISGAERKQKIDECIAQVNAPGAK